MIGYKGELRSLVDVRRRCSGNKKVGGRRWIVMEWMTVDRKVSSLVGVRRK